jgi:hypothetical protein
MIQIPAALKTAIINNDLVIFAGAGLSYNLVNIKNQKLGGWSNLVQNVLQHLIANDHDVSVLLPLLKKYQAIKVLDLLESNTAIPRMEVQKFLKDFLDVSTENNFGLHQKLHGLSNKIITTNYDTAFEQAVPDLRKSKAYKGKNYELTYLKDKNASLLFKLHGCFEDADSMVLFPSNYRELYENPKRDAQHALLALQNIIVNKTVLFVGVGMGDHQINSIFKEIKELQGAHNQQHFVITTNNKIDSTLDFVTALQIADFLEIESVIDAMLAIKQSADCTETPKILELKRQLAEAKKRIHELEKTADQTHLLEREALKYFSRGVEFSLANKFSEAIQQYEGALQLKPDMHEAYNNWGAALGGLAATKEGAAAEALYTECFAKYEKAVEYKPDMHEAYYNWGNHLGNLAATKEGAAAEALYTECFAKYEKALAIKPDMHEAYNNWGYYLGCLAATKEGAAAEALYSECFAKYDKALAIKRDMHEVYNNWGTTLGKLAATKEGAAAEALYTECFAKYEKAVECKPDMHEVYYNWGNHLGNLAATKEGAAAEALYTQCFAKYEKAVELKPDMHEIYNNWGNRLGNLAATKEGAAAEALYTRCFAKYEKAVELKPDMHDAYYNWGNELGNLAATKEGAAAEALYTECFSKYEKAVECKPEMHEAYYNWGTELGKLAATKEGAAAEALYTECFSKYEKAVECKPDMHEAYYNWGTELGKLAATKEGAAAKALYALSIEKYTAAIELGGSTYNLACTYALIGDKDNALQYLTLSLTKKEVEVSFVVADTDWQSFHADNDFIDLIDKFGH